MIGPHDEKRLRALLADKYGTILSLTEECPLVYYVCAAMEDGAAVPQEYFVVDKKSPAISKRAKCYGSPLDMEPELLYYAFSDIHSGYKIIQYEMSAFKKGKRKQTISALVRDPQRGGAPGVFRNISRPDGDTGRGYGALLCVEQRRVLHRD